MKRILFTRPNVAEVVEREIGLPGEGEIQVKLAVSSISAGTERANLTGEINVNSTRFDTEAHFPRSGGYSSAGIVTIGGYGFETGQRVALCWSSHSELLNIKASNVYQLPDDISFEEAALFNIATFPMAAVRKCRAEMGEPAIVMGLGVLGMIAVDLLKLAGCVPVIAVDPDEEKRAWALERGADFAFSPYEQDFASKVKAVTGGGAHVGIEVTGLGIALDQVLDCMARMGRVALLGCTRNNDFALDYYHKVHGPGITLIGAHTDARPKQDSYGGCWTQKDDIQALIRLIQFGRLNLKSLIQETYNPMEAGAVYHRLAFDKAFPITQFDWRKL